MKQNIETVAEMLEEIKDAYVQMTALSEKKQECIIKGDAQAVSEAVKEEWELLKVIAGLEETRESAVNALRIEWDMLDGDLTLTEIKSRADGDLAEKIKRTGDELKDVIETQKELNNQNKALLRLHFAYMDFVMENFYTGAQTNNIYGNSGVMQEMAAGNAGIIDSHV